MCRNTPFFSLVLCLGAPATPMAARTESEMPGLPMPGEGRVGISELEVSSDLALSSHGSLHAVNASSADSGTELATAFAPACCCKTQEINKCKYVIQFLKKHEPWCCKLRDGGCPTLSHYITMSNEKRCYTEDWRQSMLGHPSYELLAPGTLKPKGPLDWKEIQPASIGGISLTYLGRHREQRSSIVALRFPNKRPETKKIRKKGIQQFCDNAAEVQRRILKSSAGRPRAAHVITCLDFDKHMPFAVLPYHTGASKQLLMPKLATARMVKQVFVALNSLRLSKPAQALRRLSWASFGVDHNSCLRITDMNSIFVEKIKKDKPWSKTTYPVLVGADPIGGRDVDDVHVPPECRRKNDQVPCFLGSSFDVYGAGVLAALSLCGAPEFYILRGLRDDEAKLDKEVQQFVKMGFPGKEALYMAGYIRARNEWHSAKMHKQVDFLKAEIDRMNARHVGLERENRIEQAFRSKWAFCKAMTIYEATEDAPSGRLTVLDRLRSSNPKRRPSPAQVLESAMFRWLDTGCPKDNNKQSKKGGGGR